MIAVSISISISISISVSVLISISVMIGLGRKLQIEVQGVQGVRVSRVYRVSWGCPVLDIENLPESAVITEGIKADVINADFLNAFVGGYTLMGVAGQLRRAPSICVFSDKSTNY